MASNFLENLKNDLDKGEFNSEAAKKINEITENAGKVENVKEKILKVEATYIPEEEAIKSAEYETEMEKIKMQDVINQQTALLIEFQDVTKMAIDEMMAFTKELHEKFGKELDSNDPAFDMMRLKLEEIKNVYEPTLVEYKHKE